jgi:hypothetical protein
MFLSLVQQARSGGKVDAYPLEVAMRSNILFVADLVSRLLSRYPASLRLLLD